MHSRVLITRHPSRSVDLIEALRAQNIRAVAEPVTATERIAEAASLPDLSRVDWVAFTSAQGVEIFADIVHESGRILPPEVRLAAVGSATAEVVATRLRPPDIISTGNGGADLAKAILENHHGETGFSVLWPCARDAQPDFQIALSAAGANVIRWAVYATEFIPPWLLHSRLEHPTSFDVVVFAAPSAVRSLKETWPEPWTFVPVAIGETTAQTLRHFLMTDCIVSRSPQTPDLVAAIREALKGSGRPSPSITSIERT